LKNELSRKWKVAYAAVERAQRLISLPVAGSLALALARLTGHRRLTMLVRGTAMLRKVHAGFPFYCGENVVIRCPEKLFLGRDVTFMDGVFVNAGGGVSIGDRSYLSFGCSIHGDGGVTMGRRTGLAAGARVFSQTKAVGRGEEHEFDILDFDSLAPVVFEDDVGIGANSVVLPGVTIGEHSAVGAMSMVNRDIPPESMALGIPARVTRKRRFPKA
jgi:acetyltransferase-like isoleucine patch superfamily enzyme